MSANWDAYVRAELRIDAPAGPVRVYPAPALQATGGYPDPDRRPIAIITAHNPGGQTASPEANDARQRELEAVLASRGLTWWPAAGADPEWTHVEESAAIPGLSQPDALALGLQFGQEAVFLLTPAGRKVIDCATGTMSMTGWHIDPWNDADLGDDDHDHEHADDGIEVTVFADPAPVPAGIAGYLEDLLEYEERAIGDARLLAESRWADDEADADSAGGPAGESGEYLIRVGTRYVILETNGAEYEFDDVNATSDQTAVAAFSAFLGISD